MNDNHKEAYQMRNNHNFKTISEQTDEQTVGPIGSGPVGPTVSFMYTCIHVHVYMNETLKLNFLTYISVLFQKGMLGRIELG